MAKKLIPVFKFNPGFVTPDTNLYPNTAALLEANKKYIIEELIAYIQYNVDNNLPPFVFYTYNAAKCRRDASYIIDGIISDLKHGGNRQTRFNAQQYWLGGVAQVDGDRQPEVFTYTFLNSLLQNYILINAAFASRQAVLTQTITATNGEVNGRTAVANLNTIITQVIDTGLDALPALTNNRGSVVFPGFVKLKEILLITNTTRNIILYNFADPNNKIELTYEDSEYSTDFPGAVYGTDRITTITFDIDTKDMLVTDNIQIFVESKDQKIRMSDINTDAMERVKVGLPQAMLDADFEYGLQPTKWQQISLMRNYPGAYEIPGSDTAIVNVVTDASSATADIGASLITVTTSNNHGFIVGDVVTIKALSTSVLGFSRSEGTFVINAVPSLTTFNYYAKAKVGTTNGEVLATGNTQLRKGAFYSGAEIGNATFSVFSAGSTGTITTELITPSGSSTIGFTGSQPPFNAPISGTGVISGSTITSVNGDGTTQATTKLTLLGEIGDTVLTVDDTTGISSGLIVDRGDGVQAVVTNISGNDVTINSPLTSDILGTSQTYSNVTQNSTSRIDNDGSTVIAGTGTGAQFTINRSGGSYIVSLTNNGNSYEANDTITVLGANLTGASPANNATITVNTALSRKRVATLNNATLVGGTDYTTASGVATTSDGTGTGLTVNITASGGVVTAVTVNATGQNYQVGDLIYVNGASTDTVGQTSTLSVDGSTVGSGINFVADVTRSTSGVYSITINNPGSGFVNGDTILISGSDLGGILGVNDLIVTALTTDSLGAVLTFSLSGTGVSGNCNIEVASVNIGGEIQTVSISGTPITAPNISFLSSISISAATTAQIADNNSGITFSAISTIQVTFPSNHGFVPGNTLITQITSTGTGAQLAAGVYFVESVPSLTTIRYTARAAGPIENNLAGKIYGRADSFFSHRPFDGGVILGTGSPAHGANAIRMSKKYIRYQSGKGAMYNTGALFAPSYDIRTLTATGTGIGATITLTTDDVDHGCQVGGVIRILGVTTSGYNGTYAVASIINERSLTILSTKNLGSATATIGSPCLMSVLKWHGATVRAGIFDDQNGMFWQYDGQKLAVVKRSSTQQLAGSITLSAGSNSITGSNTRFRDQLIAGDKIVIKGMTHTVSNISSQTAMTVTPDFRGVSNLTDAKISKTIDLITPQEDFNLDTLLGSGSSGYSLDITKMQMIGIQHTWYGAGFIDFMLRGSDGNYLFAHRYRNSNINTEAYMRTGNLPVRYEVTNEGARGRLTSSMTNNQTTIPMSEDDLYYFPSSGTVYVDNELITYTNKTNSALVGCTRASSLTQFTAGSSRSFTAGSAATHDSGTGVVLISNTITPNISHWGSAFLIDGRFDEDRGYIFSYSSTGISATVDKKTAFLIRLAPSVSNAAIGDLGEKELLNRAQLLLSSISISADAQASGSSAIVIEGVLNPQNYPVNPALISWSGLGTSAAGGQPSFAQIASGGSVDWGASATTSTATVLGQLTSTITAKSFNESNNTLTATSFTNSTSTVTARQVNTIIGSRNYNNTVQSGQNDFLITMTDYNTLLSTDPLNIPANGFLGDNFIGTGFSSGSTISSITPSYTTVSTTVYARIIMVANASTSGSGNINYTRTNPYRSRYQSAISSARNDFLVPQSSLGASAVNSVLGSYELRGLQITGTAGQFSCTASPITLTTGMGIRFTGTFAGPTPGSISGYTVAGQTYSIVATNGSTTFTLSTTFGGAGVTTVVGGAPILGVTFVIVNGYSNAQLGTTSGAVPRITSNQTISDITQNIVTLAGTAYARITMSAFGNTTPTGGTGNDVTNIKVTTANTFLYRQAISNGRTDVLITDTQYNTSGILVGDTIRVTRPFSAGAPVNLATVVITGTSGQFSCASSATLSVGMSITITGTYGGSGSISGYVTGTTYFIMETNGTTTFRLSSVNPVVNREARPITTTAGTPTGLTYVANTFFTPGLTINTITTGYVSIGGVSHTRIILSATPTLSSERESGNDISLTAIAVGSAATYTSSNFLFFGKSNFDTSGAQIGTRLASSVTSFPSGTAITSITARTFGGTEVYRVLFTQSSNTSIAESTSITFTFGSAFATPGETVFSFVSNTGESNELSLETLKELTATTLGGRGAFPNGPDVLAINVLKVAGTASNVNVTLRWGEAQA